MVRKENMDIIFIFEIKNFTLTNVYMFLVINKSFVSGDLSRKFDIKVFISPKDLYYPRMRNLFENAILLNELSNYVLLMISTNLN